MECDFSDIKPLNSLDIILLFNSDMQDKLLSALMADFNMLIKI